MLGFAKDWRYCKLHIYSKNIWILTVYQVPGTILGQSLFFHRQQILMNYVLSDLLVLNLTQRSENVFGNGQIINILGSASHIGYLTSLQFFPALEKLKNIFSSCTVQKQANLWLANPDLKNNLCLINHNSKVNSHYLKNLDASS